MPATPIPAPPSAEDERLVAQLTSDVPLPPPTRDFYVRRTSGPDEWGCMTIREIRFELVTTRLECPPNPCSGGGTFVREPQFLRRVAVDAMDITGEMVRGLRWRLPTLVSTRRDELLACFDGFGTFLMTVPIAIVDGRMVVPSISGAPDEATANCVLNNLRAIEPPRITTTGSIVLHLRFDLKDPRLFTE